MKQELLPCPWCGNQPKCTDHQAHKNACVVYCNTDGCPVNEGTPSGPNSFTIDEWNTRAPDSRVQLLAEALIYIKDNAEASGGFEAIYMPDDTSLEVFIDAVLAEAEIN